MDFTELYKQSLCLCLFSPDNNYLATTVQHRLVIRDAESLQITHLYSSLHPISDIAWSPDAKYILAASYPLGQIQVWSLDADEKEWTAKIDQGTGGCVKCIWSPTGRDILSFSEFGLRVTIWSLVDRSVRYIQYPKHTDKGYAFRKDGKYFAIAERRDANDYIGIYDCEDWSLIKHFQVDTTDLEDISWSPDGRFIAVWNSLLEYQIHIYHPDGRLVKSYSPYPNDQNGQCMGLGIKSVKWSPSSQFVAVGSFDQKARLLNHYTFNPTIELSHSSTVTLSRKNDFVIFRETNLRSDYSNVNLKASVNSKQTEWPKMSSSTSAKPRLYFEPVFPPREGSTTVTSPSTKVDPDKPSLKMGISVVEFNPDGKLLATRNDTTPTTLHIFSIPSLRVVSIIQTLSPVKSIHWCPTRTNLLSWSCGNGMVYLWDGDKKIRRLVDVDTDEGYQEKRTEGEEEGSTRIREEVGEEVYGGVAVGIDVEGVNFAVHSLRWAPDGKSMVVMDKDKFCLGFLDES
ncbi:quinon protein alcohol dehydrogenase-like superfamily [Paraphysoderma sedebokerense]|nr:quinon protein alcohol dehydrogenase-like superfamily [Paraphysoderma sedebokerense]